MIVACRNFGLFDRHLNLGGPVDTNLPLPGFLVSVKAFYDNNFLSHFGEESELRYAFLLSYILFTWSNNQFWNYKYVQFFVSLWTIYFINPVFYVAKNNLIGQEIQDLKFRNWLFMLLWFKKSPSKEIKSNMKWKCTNKKASLAESFYYVKY